MKRFVLVAVIIFIVPALAAVVLLQPASDREADARVAVLAPMAEMPDFVHDAHPEAQHAYRFAAANHDLLTHFPCYCGCVYMGHNNNADCYIEAISDTGEIVFDTHASACGICVEITNDVARLWAEGQQIPEIYDAIVAAYSHRGPSTELEV